LCFYLFCWWQPQPLPTIKKKDYLSLFAQSKYMSFLNYLKSRLYFCLTYDSLICFLRKKVKLFKSKTKIYYGFEIGKRKNDSWGVEQLAVLLKNMANFFWAEWYLVFSLSILNIPMADIFYSPIRAFLMGVSELLNPMCQLLFEF
jgi:hypothetical protein